MRRRTKFFLAAAVVAIATGGAAYATIPDSGGVLHGCVSSLGTLRLIDPSTGAKCLKGETAVQWNQQGPQGVQGPQGAQGPQGPHGPPGTIASLDNLEGIPCTGVNGKIATVHLSYGAGIEAPVQIICVTHLVANPGPFSFTISGGEFQAFAGGFPIQGGTLTGGQIDFGGHITAPGSSFHISEIPFSNSTTIDGVTVQAQGTVSFASAAIEGSLDPASGAMSLSDSAYASVTFSASVAGLGLYSGTCDFGTSADPISLTLNSTTPYSQTDGSVTLGATFDAPSFANCNPDPGILGVVLKLFLGSDSLTLTGTTSPIIKAP
jgi:hypothetical protein